MWNALLLILLLIPSQWGRDNDRLPWGQGAWSSVSWQHRMLRSYQSIHGALPDSAYTELYDRLSPGTYLDSTFGTLGSHEKVCNFLFLLQHDGNTVAGTWTKSGDALRWDDGDTVIVSDNFPALSGGGILTCSTTDGWTGVTKIYINNNPNLVGVMPNWSGIGLTNLTLMYICYDYSLEGDIDRFGGLTKLTYLRFDHSGVEGDLASIAGLTKLQYLLGNLSGVYGDIANLAGMTDLIWVNIEIRYLNIYGDIAVYAALEHLTVIESRQCAIYGDLSSFERTNMEVLNISSTIGAITGDLSDISGMVNLTRLNVSSVHITGDLSDLSAMTKVTTLVLSSPLITGDISSLSAMLDMWSFEIGGCVQVTGDVALFNTFPDILGIDIRWTHVYGDLKDIADINTMSVYSYGDTMLTVTGRFANPILLYCYCFDMGWDSTEVNQVLHDYRLLADEDSLVPTTIYYIKLGKYRDGTGEEVNPEPTAPNAAPGVLGLADIAAILAWNAANGGRVRVYYNP